jgi:hypothetical protein
MGPFRRTLAAALTATFLVPAGLFAQQPKDSGTGKKAAAATDSEETPPVSLDRIRRQLTATRTSSKSGKDRLRLEYYVEVYGRAPRIELILPTENITNTPVMYGGMTHQEFLQVVTPQEFKSPPADIGAAVTALVKWLSDKQKNSQTPKK